MKTIGMNDFIARHGDDTIVVDVREAGEYVQGHLPGALLIPLGQLPLRKGEVPSGGTVYVICRSGNRSKVGASVLEAAGLDALSVDGGTMAWIASGQPVVTGQSPR